MQTKLFDSVEAAFRLVNVRDLVGTDAAAGRRLA
jgi:hypothetical protein